MDGIYLLQDISGPGYVPYTLEDFKKINHEVKLSALGYVETEDKIRGVCMLQSQPFSLNPFFAKR